MGRLYNYEEKNRFSNDPVWDEIFEAFYNAALPAVTKVEKVTDKARQLKGIDKIVYCGGRPLYVDEKVRRTNYDDVALQLFANRETGYLGWATRPGKKTDLIAYAIPRRSLVYMIPFRALLKVVEVNGARWEAEYGLRESRNFDRRKNCYYTDVTLPVPADVLSAAIDEYLGGKWPFEKFARTWYFPEWAIELLTIKKETKNG